MTIGKGITIAGIWIGTGLSFFTPLGFLIGLLAFIVTLTIVENKE